MNEPVAYVDNVWINRPDLAMDLGIGQMFSRCQLSDYQIPLYTHPVKELTDEEIIELWKQAIQDGYTEMIIHDSQTLDTKKTMFEFARAILRKASEK